MNHGSNKAFFYLFTLGLFKDLDSRVYIIRRIASNDKMIISEEWTGIDVKGSGRGLISAFSRRNRSKTTGLYAEKKPVSSHTRIGDATHSTTTIAVKAMFTF
jgi:hypothetical protein